MPAAFRNRSNASVSLCGGQGRRARPRRGVLVVVRVAGRLALELLHVPVMLERRDGVVVEANRAMQSHSSCTAGSRSRPLSEPPAARR